ncbi:MAG: AAA domain-containing protein, partial [Planctomycetota bacterium]
MESHHRNHSANYVILMDVEQHFKKLDHWLSLESEAEAERISNRNAIKDSKAAESTGESLLDLIIADSELEVGDRCRYTFIKRNRELQLPWNRFRVGTPVLISQFRVDQPENWNGVVTRVKREWIQIAGPSWMEGEHFRVDFAADEITRRRATDAMDVAKTATGRLGKLCRVLTGQSEPEFSKNELNLNWCNDDLNDSQKEAVQFALAANDLAIIHGPPGTGKTTTVVELIVQCAKRGDKVLACAPSNTAVDNLVTKLLSQTLRPVRLGHPARIAEHLQSQTLASLVLGDPNMRVAQEMVRESEELFRKLDRFTRARPEPGAKREMWQEAKRLRKDAKLMEKQAVKHVLDQAQIICSTCTLDDTLLKDLKFNTLVIDEACQTTEPPCWIPIIRSEKIVLAGDHRQLPPTIISKKAANDGFATSMMERLIEQYQSRVTRMLEVQ